ncbi:MAG: glycosyltransferase family 2 protein [Ruminococcus sp.]|jgi:dolichol-phosphate mannosyltransferase
MSKEKAVAAGNSLLKVSGENLMKENLWIVIPAYNEEKNIRTVIEQWHKIVEKTGEDSKILLVNDGSTDQTREIALQLQKDYPRLLVETKKNGGHGAAVLYGYHWAIAHGADYIFQTDSDGQTLPEEFWPLWKDRESAGLLLGSRRRRQDGMGRIVVTKTLKLIVFLNFGVWMEDINTPFRLMRSKELKKILKLVPKDYHLANVIISVLYKKSKRTVKYYPITFRPRQGGKNSVNFRKICTMGRRALTEFYYMRKKYRKV